MDRWDVIVIGAGAAGMMCAAQAGRRGRSVLVLDHARVAGEKIRISGGVRKDGEGRLFAFLQAWAWSNHQAGIAKGMILDSIAKAGMDVAKLPPEMKF